MESATEIKNDISSTDSILESVNVENVENVEPDLQQPIEIPSFPAFDDIPVSTKTLIAMTNLNLDLNKLFDFLPVVDIPLTEIRKGRRRQNDISPSYKISPGSIISLEIEDKRRGVDIKKRKVKRGKKTGKWFRNSFTVVLSLGDKNINFKICKNGRFQFTGCKSNRHAYECIKYIWSYIKYNNEIYSFVSGNYLDVIFIPAMRNIDFNMGFYVDREKLAHYMSTQTEFHSLLETSFGYTGCNIKVPIKIQIGDLILKRMKYLNEQWNTFNLSYSEYLEYLDPKERQKKSQKDRYNTFLVFHSGKVIMSGLTGKLMRDTYDDFCKTIKKCYPFIKETLDIDIDVENDNNTNISIDTNQINTNIF